MNILLCMPDGPYQLTGWSAPPIGIAYVSSALKAAGHNVWCVNFMLEKRAVREALEQEVAEHQIELVATGDLVVNYVFMKEIIDTAKDINPNLKTLIGGGFVTYSPQEAMLLIPSADYGVVGEGEITCCKLVSALESDSCLSEVHGVIYRENNDIVFSGERTEYLDLEDIPIPDYDGFGLGAFIEAGSASVVTSRSCPYSCTFCSHSGGRKYRQRSLDSVFKEIDILVHRYGAKRLLLNDELFSVMQERVSEFCARIKAYRLKWYVFLRISDNLTTELLMNMKDAGCELIFYGIESADNKVLESMNKRITIEQIERVLIRTKEAKIEARGNFIFGDAEEDMETVQNTINWVRNHSDLLQYIKLTPIILYPGSPLYDRNVKNGKIKNTLEFIKSGCPAINVSKLTDDEYSYLINELLPSEQASLLEAQKMLTFEQAPACDREGIYYFWRCPNCSEINERTASVSDIYIAKKTVDPCGECGQEISYNAVYEYVDFIDQRVMSLILEHRCALWGAGWLLMHIYDRVSVLSNPGAEYWICDRSPTKQSGGFRSHSVYSPEILREAEIDICIITSTYVDEIKREIELKYPNVTAIGFHELGKYVDK